ncbi:sodium:nucleoside cotransporter 2 [Echinococcus multilocularis]|uniref:Sodium:nucleoside cotransporter 2 n=1 Tax=Echinococcus multilocularis TaxID=6211 RepID=A0A087VYT9_ECHMU|nr:sodium:nucleoside cotransporter 2 [Echinococcus multilocularis]
MSDVTFTLTDNEPSDGYKEFSYPEKPFTPWIEDDFPNKPDGGRRGVNKVLELYADAQKALFKKRPFADDTEPICCEGVVGLLGFLFLLLVDIAYVVYACLYKGLDRDRDVHLWLSVIFWFVVLEANGRISRKQSGWVSICVWCIGLFRLLYRSSTDCSAMSTNSELHAMIFNGFASITGPVLSAFISSGVPPNHLLIARIISPAAALAVSKIIYPETKISPVASSEFSLKLKSNYNSVLEAAMVGAMEAVSIYAGITANLIAFLSICNFFNRILIWLGKCACLEFDLTFKVIFSYVLWPIVITMGVPMVDALKVAKINRCEGIPERICKLSTAL